MLSFVETGSTKSVIIFRKCDNLIDGEGFSQRMFSVILLLSLTVVRGADIQSKSFLWMFPTDFFLFLSDLIRFNCFNYS